MRNKRLFVVLAGAAFFGLIAAIAVSRFLSDAQARPKDLNQIVVAKVDIPLGTKIIAEQLSTVEFPSGAMPEGTFNSVDKVIGRATLTNVAAREAITEPKLAAEGASGGLSAIISEGYRAMTVKVDDVVGVSGFIMPGSLVDVVVVINPPEQNLNQNPISKIVLQNIKVLANGQNIDGPKKEREPESVRAVTLQVTPEQAEKLALAATEGRLQLVMRNSVDQSDAQTLGVNKHILLGGEQAWPVPKPGVIKNDQPNSRPAMPPVQRSFVRVYPSIEETRKAAAPEATSAPRASVEMIEGAKKRNVEFP